MEHVENSDEHHQHTPSAQAQNAALLLSRDHGAQESVCRSGVDMVALTVTVTGPNGRSVSGLTADSFAVFEDGVQQNVSLFG